MIDVDLKTDSHQRAYDELARMLRRIVDGKLTGNFQLSVTANQGGVRDARSFQVIVFEDK